MLTNRINPLLTYPISPNQAKFIEGRRISESHKVDQEFLHKMRHIRARRVWIGMKNNFSKAFNKMKWPFLVAVLNFF